MFVLLIRTPDYASVVTMPPAMIGYITLRHFDLVSVKKVNFIRIQPCVCCNKKGHKSYMIKIMYDKNKLV